MCPSVLIVDDDVSILYYLRRLLIDYGFEVFTAVNGYDALKIVGLESPDLVLLDVWMPGIDGIETLKELKKNNPILPVIMISGQNNIKVAVKSIKLGAYDLIEKPLSFEMVIRSIKNALNFNKFVEKNRYLRRKNVERHLINGTSKVIQKLKKQISIIAHTNVGILVEGENGTGKSLVVRAIHQLSMRAQSRLVEVNCSVIPDFLIESELFGYERGFFKGTTNKKRGKFELANGGTLFLDEICDMSMTTQAKILRVLQEKKIRRIGGEHDLEVDVRVIAATNKNLEIEIKRNRFRKDLYYSLNIIPIYVPSLRERNEDIPELVKVFFKKFAERNLRKIKVLSFDAMELLKSYYWPGNVRELENLIERLSVIIPRDVVSIEDIPFFYVACTVKHQQNELELFFDFQDINEAKKAFEVEFIRRKMMLNGNDIDKTAKAIGIKSNYIKEYVE